MELRTCDSTHFIQTIKGGLLQKVCNKDSNGRPFTRFMSLKDVYRSKDAKRLQIRPSDLVFDHQQVEHEIPCFLVADRTFRENNPEFNFDSGSDDNTTLKQIKKRVLKKKRKRIPIDEDSQKDDDNEKAAEDDSYLHELLISWKSKNSMTSKAKRKRLNSGAISSSTIDVAITTEENSVSECSPQAGDVPALLIGVEFKYPDTEPLGCLNRTTSGHASSIELNDVPNLGQKKRVLNEYNMSETCVTNQINYDDSEDDIPMSILFSSNVKTPESSCRESLDLPSVEVEKQTENKDSHRAIESLSEETNAEDTSEERCISGTQVPDMAIDGCGKIHLQCIPVDKNEADFTNKPNDSQSSLDNDPSRVIESLSEETNAEDTPERRCISGTQVPEMAIGGCVKIHHECSSIEKNEADFRNEPNDSQSSLDNNSHRVIEALSEETNAEDMSGQRCISGTQVPEMAIDGCVKIHQECISVGKNEANFTNESNNAQSSLDNNSCRVIESLSEETSAEDTSGQRCISSTQVPEMAIDGCVKIHQESISCNKNEADFTNEPNDSQTSFDYSHRAIESLSEETNAEDSEETNAEDTSEERCTSGTQIPDMAIDVCVKIDQECISVDKNEADSRNEGNDSQTSLDYNSHRVIEALSKETNAEGTTEERCISGTQVPGMGIDGCVKIQHECISVDKVEAVFTSEPNDSQSSLDNNSHRVKESLSEETNAEDTSEDRCISGSQVSDVAIDGCVKIDQECVSVDKNEEADFRNEPNDSQSRLDNNCESNLVSITPSKIIADKEQPSTSSIMRNELSCVGRTKDELVKTVDKQNSALTIPEASVETISSLKAYQPSERLLSSRKALSPSSQEQLRLALSSDEVCNDSNRNIVLECKEKFFENQTEKNDSSPNSNIKKFPKGPRRIVRKSRSLVAKGNLEGPRFSRTLPNVSSALSSVQGCSEGAIAFSQRQMQDMETLAERLMKELKSMKDIVEQKLLFEAYRNASIKNDADEVKSAIDNATKVEEMGRRYMSMIARDCTRFCKIMKMTPDASVDTSPREKKKIRFADESGGQLCHIKYFDLDDEAVAAPQAPSDPAKQM